MAKHLNRVMKQLPLPFCATVRHRNSPKMCDLFHKRLGKELIRLCLKILSTPPAQFPTTFCQERQSQCFVARLYRSTAASRRWSSASIFMAPLKYSLTLDGRFTSCAKHGVLLSSDAVHASNTIALRARFVSKRRRPSTGAMAPATGCNCFHIADSMGQQVAPRWPRVVERR